MRAVRHLVAVLVLGLAGPLAGQSAEQRVRGAEIRLNSIPDRGEVRGELLAATGDTLWVEPARGGGLMPIAFGDVVTARVRAHGAGARWTGKWVALGWGVTSLGLFGACQQVDGFCGGVPLVVAIPWGLIGGIAAWSNESGTWLDFPRERFPELPGYARFPQGLPEAMRP